MISRKQRKPSQLLLLLIPILTLALGSLTLAQSELPNIAWWTVDGGGGTSSDGMYKVSGSIGQPEAGDISGDGRYRVTGGFWGVAAPPPATRDALFLPFVRR